MPNDLFFKAGNSLHKAISTITGGRAGWNLMGMPVLELVTIGRKSGERRSVMLTSPVQDGDAYVIVASKGGDPKHPAWYHNLVANPEVEVTLKGGKKQPMRARVATADERARLWPQVTAKYKGYGDYQKRAEREIPLVLLEPVD